jgi:ferredoxin
VDCFHIDESVPILYIDPIECIDCNACVPVCPVEAIYPEEDVPEQWQEYIQLNADKAADLPVITEMLDALDGC